MEIRVKEILEGWRNDSFPPKKLKELITSTANERLSVCRECEFNSDKARELHNYSTMRKDYHCTNCGCPLKKKTKCLSCKCPVNRWEAIVTKEQEEELKKNI